MSGQYGVMVPGETCFKFAPQCHGAKYRAKTTATAPATATPATACTPPLANGKKTKGRVKIKMEFIDNKLRRYTTFSKRKTGIMKKAYELSTLTGTQVMLLVASETGHVYTFATSKLQPMITSESGKALIQTCLNSTAAPQNGQKSTSDNAFKTEPTENLRKKLKVEIGCGDESVKTKSSPMFNLADLPTMVPPASTFFASPGGSKPSSPSSSPSSSSSSDNDDDFELDGGGKTPPLDFSAARAVPGDTPPVLCRSVGEEAPSNKATKSAAKTKSIEASVSSLMRSVVNSGDKKTPSNRPTAHNLFPFAAGFLPNLAAAANGQAAAFGFLPTSGFFPNGLVYAASAAEDGQQSVMIGGSQQQQQFITIPFPVPLTQAMLASQIFKNLLSVSDKGANSANDDHDDD